MTTRRELLKQSTTVAAMLASLGMYPHVAWAQSSTYNAAAFEAKYMGDLMKALGGGTPRQALVEAILATTEYRNRFLP